MNKLFVALVAVTLLLVCCSKDEPLYNDQPPVALIEKDSLTELSVYPNPFKSNFSVSFNSAQAGNISYALFDVAGRNLVSGDYMAAKYSNVVVFNMDTFASGLYFLRIEAFDISYIRKIVKQN